MEESYSAVMGSAQERETSLRAENEQMRAELTEVRGQLRGSRAGGGRTRVVPGLAFGQSSAASSSWQPMNANRNLARDAFTPTLGPVSTATTLSKESPRDYFPMETPREAEDDEPVPAALAMIPGSNDTLLPPRKPGVGSSEEMLLPESPRELPVHGFTALGLERLFPPNSAETLLAETLTVISADTPVNSADTLRPPRTLTPGNSADTLRPPRTLTPVSSTETLPPAPSDQTLPPAPSDQTLPPASDQTLPPASAETLPLRSNAALPPGTHGPPPNRMPRARRGSRERAAPVLPVGSPSTTDPGERRGLHLLPPRETQSRAATLVAGEESARRTSPLRDADPGVAHAQEVMPDLRRNPVEGTPEAQLRDSPEVQLRKIGNAGIEPMTGSTGSMADAMGGPGHSGLPTGAASFLSPMSGEIKPEEGEHPADDHNEIMDEKNGSILCQPCYWFPRPDVTVSSWYELPRALNEIGIDESDLKDKIFPEMLGLDGHYFLPNVLEKDIVEAFENFTQPYLAWQFLDGPADALFPDHVVTELFGVVNDIQVRYVFG